MSSAAISVEDFEAVLLKAQSEKTAAVESEFSTRTLVWLALPPFWHLKLAEKGFPIKETRTAKDKEAVELFERLEHAGWIVKEHDSNLVDDVIFVMSPLHKSRVVKEVVKERLKNEVSGLRYLQNETVKISKFISSNLKKSKQTPTVVLNRWLELGRRTDNFELLSSYLTEQISKILGAAREAKQTSAPEALRWLETFTPFVDIFGTQLEAALTRARREYEIFNRRTYDQRYLSNYLIRQEQDDAFIKLLNTADEKNIWALHYVGMGGMGKTMLMRHLNAELADEKNLAVARVDFDYLNPDYPARQPGLLLLSFAVELNAYLGSSKGFQKFEKQVREWHRQLAFEGTGKNNDFSKNPKLLSLIHTFVGELNRLPRGMRPLLILDTCEELAKLRPDGSLPDSVRVTFDILEKIHDLMPNLRVVFSGRRPLASKGYGWRLSNLGKDSPLNKLPRRPYMMLHEIRGFDEDEAKTFLEKFKKGAVPEKLFNAILKRSLIEEKNTTQLFNFHKKKSGIDVARNAQGAKEDVRYNPFELDIYAALTADKPDLDEKKLAGAHFYVKERIVDRVNEKLKKRLPEITLLGRFDKAIIRQLYAANDKDKFDTFFDELISQEWIDIERGASSFPSIETAMGETIRKDTPTIWGMQDNIRARLLAYYKEETDQLKTANKRIAPLLEEITLGRDWDKLSIAYFESAIQTLTAFDKERAALWWEKVEAKLAETARWDWAHTLTSQLLADEGVAGRKEETLGHDPKTENILRPAILATHAAALIHLKMQGVLLIWNEIKENSKRHPLEKGREILELRTKFGLYANHIGRNENNHLTVAGFITDLKNELTDLYDETSNALNKSPQLFASAIAAIEQAAEICERIKKENVGVIYEEELTRRISELNKVVLNLLNTYHQQLPSVLICFLQILCARLALLVNDWETAEHQFENSHSLLNTIRESKEQTKFRQTWLDWNSPDDFEARIWLEYLRGTSPRFQTPESASNKIPEKESNFSIDADRCGSALMINGSYTVSPNSLRTDEETLSAMIESITSSSRQDSTINAHNEFPPLIVTLLEIKAMDGNLSYVIEQARALTQPDKNRIGVSLQKDVERMLAHFAFWFRLGNERSYNFGDSLKDSFSLEDIRLQRMHEALEVTLIDKTEFKVRGLNLFQRYIEQIHFRYRSNPRNNNPQEMGIGITNLPENGHNLDSEIAVSNFKSNLENMGQSFYKAAFFFDQAEYELREKNKGGISSQKAKELSKLIKELEEAKDYLGAFTLDVLYASLTALPPSMSNAEKIGLRRAALIMLEEGTLLSIRRPKAAVTILQRAARLFAQLEDFIGEILSDLTLALLAIKLNKPRVLRNSLHYLKVNYAELCEREETLPKLDELIVCIDDAAIGEKRDVVYGFLNNQSKNLCWRPTLVRLLYCLAWEKASGKENQVVTYLQNWIKENYGRTEGSQFVVPSDFDFEEQTVSDTESDFAEIECVILSDRITDLNFPLGNPVGISLRTKDGQITAQTSSETTDADNTVYRTQARALPTEIRDALQKETNESSEDLLSLKLSFSPDSLTAATPWEAVFALASMEVGENYYSRFMFRRVLQRAYTPRTEKIFAPVHAFSYVADYSVTELAYLGWHELANDEKFLFEVYRSSEIELPIQHPACLLHLVGLPIEEHSRVCLEIISTEHESQSIVSQSVQYETPFFNESRNLIEASALAEMFPQLRLLVVQCPPTGFEEPRTLTDRFEMAKMRRFCAEAFQAGIGAVIMLPYLSHALSVKCLEQIAKLFSSPVDVRVEDVVRVVREIQELIADEGHSNKDDAIELSFDVCLYLHDSFEWRIETNQES